jgi:Peptidase family C25
MRRLLLAFAAALLLLAAPAQAGAARVTSPGEGVLRITNEELAALDLAGRIYVYTGGRAIDYLRTPEGIEVYSAPYASVYDAQRSLLICDRPLPYPGRSRALKPTYRNRRNAGLARFLRGGLSMPGVKEIQGPSTYLHTVRVEENQFYLSGMTEAKPGEEHWFYSTFLMPGRSLELTAELPGPMAAGQVNLKVALRGCTDIAQVSPDHRVEVRFNGQKIGEMLWNGQNRLEQSFELPAGLATTRNNTVRLTGASLAGVPFDFVCADWIEVSYPRQLAVVNDRLNLDLVAGAYQRVAVTGFSGSDVVAMDVTDPARPLLLRLTLAQKDGLWSASFLTRAAGKRSYVLAGPNGRLRISSSRASQPNSAWLRGGHRYIVVSHADHLDAARRLVALHGGRRGRARLYTATEVFDAFTTGQETPHAFRALARHHRPEYLCLLGDASADMAGRLSPPPSGLLPSYLVQGPHFEEASDNLIGCLDYADEYPEVAVGRLPARTAAEAAVLVDKIEARMKADWANYGGLTSALIVGDNDQGIFEDGADEFAGLFDWGSVEKVMFADYGTTAAIRTAIISGWKENPRYFVFYGHAATTYLGKKKVLRTSQMPSLVADDLPAGIILACLAGYYNAYWGGDSLAERMLKEPGKGACAMIAPSGMSAPEGQLLLGRELARLLKDQPGLPLGKALMLAKRRLPAPHSDVLRSFNLLGDPKLR